MKDTREFAAGASGPASTYPGASPRNGTPPNLGEADSDASPRRDGDGSDATAPRKGFLRGLLGIADEVVGSADTLIEIYQDRMRLSVQRTVVRTVLAAAAGICAAVWVGGACLAVVRGIIGGFTAAFDGRVWLGDLTGGLVALALAAGAVALALRESSRREFQRLKAKYERIRNEPDKS